MRGVDAESAAAKERALIEATRPAHNDLGPRPVGLIRWIAVMHERIRHR